MKAVIGILVLFALTVGIAQAKGVRVTLDPTSDLPPEDPAHRSTA
jgi:hypothetical protein